MPLDLCRGQSYDNASNMSGIYKGVQARMTELNPLAVFVPCSAHSLNLVGSAAATCCSNTIAFFDLLQKIYVFFSASTHRWEVLNKYLSAKKKTTSIKKLSDTRWAARYEACSALAKDWDMVIAAGEEIKNDTSQKSTIVSEIEGILKQMNTLETAILVVLWNKILKEFNKISKTLQNPKIDVAVVVELYGTLTSSVSECRDKFEDYEEKAMDLSKIEGYKKQAKKRVKKRKKFFDETADCDQSNFETNARENFRIGTFLPIIDRLLIELEYRKNAYVEFVQKFLFLSQLPRLSDTAIEKNAEILIQTYKNDVGKELISELLILKHHLKQQKLDDHEEEDHEGSIDGSDDNDNVSDNDIPLRSLYNFIARCPDLYPNTEIVLQMFLSTSAANCTAERSFSVMNRINDSSRCTMKEKRLNYMAVLNMNADITSSINIEDIVNDFAVKKSRKRLF